MNDPELIITERPAGRKGYVVLIATLDDKPILTDEIRITSASARSKFIKCLCEGREGINKDDVAMQLERMAGRAVTDEGKREATAPSTEIEYIFTETGIEYLKPTREGPVPVKLTNFTARIVSDVIRDDGIERIHSLEIEARLAGRIFRFTVPANKFPSLNWCIDHLGPKAIVYAGFSLKDHARVAIQQLSTDIENREVFVHTGWREVDGQGYCYLHANGAVGPKGPVMDIEVQLPVELSRFALPAPPEGEDLHRAVQSALELLLLGPKHITYPLLAAIWRAVLGDADFSLHLAGATGVFKSEAAALFQSFFGKSLDVRNFPGSWSSTENAIEELCFVAKDAVVVVDDFAPTGTSYDVQRFHKKADRVFRAQGNRSGRGRLRSDGTLKQSRPPRGLIFSTGEDIPAGESLRARLLVQELSQGDIGTERLTACQEASRAGHYAETMAGFLQWVAGRYGDLRARLESRIPELRNEATKIGQHCRTPTIVAELQAGFEIFLDFAVDVGAISASESDRLRTTSWEALGEAAAAQAHHQEASEPTAVFFQLLRSAIATGEAHVADADGEVPADEGPEALGWRKHKSGTGDEWRPHGALVGWIKDDDLCLEPGAAFKAAQKMATDTDRINVAKKTLIKRLREKGYLVSRDEGREKNTVRVHLQGSRRSVLHLRASTLVFRAQRAQQAQETVKAENNTDYDAIPVGPNEEPDLITGPSTEPITPCKTTPHISTGPEGPVGPITTPYTPKDSGNENAGPVPGEELEEEVEWTD